MKNQLYIYLLIILAPTISYTQVSVSSTASPPDPSAMLDVVSSKKGALIPRMNMGERDAIASPLTSLLIFQTDADPGYYYNAGTPSLPNWVKLLTSLTSSLPCDGRIEIGVLPYNITSSGSYYISKNLTGTSGINIKSHNVTIDLNGFTLQGVGSTTAGILVDGVFNNISIMNGIVDAWDDQGIDASQSDNLLLKDIIASGNGDDGITAGVSAIIKNCTSINNTFNGISASRRGLIESCITSGNAGDGIYLDFDGLIQNCNSSSNLGNGITAIRDASILNSTMIRNNKDGLYLTNYCKATGNILNGNLRHGIRIAGANNYVESNMSSSNTDDGIASIGVSNTIIANVCKFNTHGYSAIVGGNNVFIKNTGMNNTTLNFNASPGNHFAPIVTSATLATASNPFSNLSF